MIRYADGRLLPYVALPMVMVCALGCEPQRTPHRYSVVVGKVVACHTETGELSVRAPRRTAEGTADQTVYCLVTDESEVYVNDKFSSMQEIQLGDTVEVIGYRQRDPQLERFVVSIAYFDRPLPAAPSPVLPPASAPATQSTIDPQSEKE